MFQKPLQNVRHRLLPAKSRVKEFNFFFSNRNNNSSSFHQKKFISMGSVFGKVSEEQPSYTTVTQTDSYAIREYQKMFVVETAYEKESGVESSRGEFMRLAKYIGVFTTPTNESPVSKEPEAISMTAPVMISGDVIEERDDKIASGDWSRSMAFILPASKYKEYKDIPQPTDPLVRVREVPPRVFAVRTFSGNIREEWTEENLKLLLTDLESSSMQGYKVVKKTAVAGDDKVGADVNWYLAGYNAPYVLPWFKTNEVMVEVAKQ